jgi:rhodanese-related sulfurtransferase
VHTFRKMILQGALILLVSSAAGLLANAFRPDGLDLLRAQQSTVAVDEASGEISLKDATLLYASGRALFLDARTQWEYEAGHIQGALFLPPGDFEYYFPDLRDRLRGVEALIAYCDGERCPLSRELAEKLHGEGFDNVYVLKNGWALWSNEKLPTDPSDLGALFGHNAKICAEDCAQ